MPDICMIYFVRMLFNREENRQHQEKEVKGKGLSCLFNTRTPMETKKIVKDALNCAMELVNDFEKEKKKVIYCENRFVTKQIYLNDMLAKEMAWTKESISLQKQIDEKEQECEKMRNDEREHQKQIDELKGTIEKCEKNEHTRQTEMEHLERSLRETEVKYSERTVYL